MTPRAAERIVRALCVPVALFAATLPAVASLGGDVVGEAALATTELDVERAARLLDQVDVDTPRVAMERARLSLYRGDCEAAAAILSAPNRHVNDEARQLWELAESCAGATVSAMIVHDERRGVSVRVQDERDQPLAPVITDVAVKVRDALRRDLGVVLPRPLRIDLVRDLFSLSAVTGLPLKAAETTGTVAVARWGRVTMISPRATALGYPWEDTLAHEMTHLAVTRASGDRAPLWLQEGVAKRLETRWRAARPHDGEPPADLIAHRALVTGQSVGIDRLGPSIAMLPTPEAASTAYAEVQSFIRFFVARQGEPALRLLFMDLRGLEGADVDRALEGATGYLLPQWITLFEHDLVARYGKVPKPLGEGPTFQKHEARSIVRWIRLGDLLMGGGKPSPASELFERAREKDPGSAPIRWREARALLMNQEPERAERALGGVEDLDVVHGAWYALFGRFGGAGGRREAAERAFSLGIAVDPLFDEVACEGRLRSESELPSKPARQRLCVAARQIPRE